MICELCHKNEANIVFQVFNNGRLSTRTICAECAMKAQKDFFKVLHTLGMQEPSKKQESDGLDTVNVAERYCAACGQPLTAPVENEVLGCPQCYQAIKDEVIEALQVDATSETEETPAPIQVETDIELMSHQLREAIISEDYEQAAALRDKIKHLANSGDAPHE